MTWRRQIILTRLKAPEKIELSLIVESQLFSQYFIVRVTIDIIMMVALVRFVYNRIYHRGDLHFTFFLLNFLVFLLSYMLEKAKAFNSLSSAFGLLAAFSLLRFRTESISAKDMTYLFIVMTLGLINSVMKATVVEIVILNLIILAAVFLVDGGFVIRLHKTRTIEYDKLENLTPEKRTELIADLNGKTGLEIQRVHIEHVDFTRKRATIKIYY